MKNKMNNCLRGCTFKNEARHCIIMYTLDVFLEMQYADELLRR